MLLPHCLAVVVVHHFGRRIDSIRCIEASLFMLFVFLVFLLLLLAINVGAVVLVLVVLLFLVLLALKLDLVEVHHIGERTLAPAIMMLALMATLSSMPLPPSPTAMSLNVMLHPRGDGVIRILRRSQRTVDNGRRVRDYNRKIFYYVLVFSIAIFGSGRIDA